LEIRNAQKHAQREIDLSREYRMRLVADVVTGKLDVRHLAPPSDSISPSDLADDDVGGSADDELPEGDDAELVEELADAECSHSL
jgi:type I restriction enzyme S subunit